MMLDRLYRTAFAVMAPLMLASCLLTPGKFVSTLIVNADRSFSFIYVGEVINAEPDDPPPPIPGSADADEAKPAKPSAADIARKKAKTDAANRTVAAALAKEAGYRKVTYLGDGVFMVDYAIRGTLDHAFVWPFNVDAEAVLPFISVELRRDGLVRIKAPAFAAQPLGSTPALADLPGGHATDETRLDGMFTIDTDAAIVSQNDEDGVKSAGARKMMTWHASPALKSAPAAVLKLAAPAP